MWIHLLILELIDGASSTVVEVFDTSIVSLSRQDRRLSTAVAESRVSIARADQRVIGYRDE